MKGVYLYFESSMTAHRKNTTSRAPAPPETHPAMVVMASVPSYSAEGRVAAADESFSQIEARTGRMEKDTPQPLRKVAAPR